VQAGEARGDLKGIAIVTPPGLAKIYSRVDKVSIVVVGLYTWVFMLICIAAILQLHFERFSEESPVVAAGAIGEAATVDGASAEVETPDNASEDESTDSPLPSTQSSSGESPRIMTLLLWQLPITSDTRLLWMVLMAGALGALVHSMRWYANYLARHTFSADWLASYLLRPFASAALAALIYAALRSGLLTATATIEDTNTFGFVVIAGFTGLFFDQAIFRLRRVSETIFDPNQNAEVNDSGTGTT
jgi:hypothetical protein